MSDKIPTWLRKPSHKKEVIATNKGWVVADTGEVLVSVRNLDQKISDLESLNTYQITPATDDKELDDLIKNIESDEPVVVVSDEVIEPVIEIGSVDEPAAVVSDEELDDLIKIVESVEPVVVVSDEVVESVEPVVVVSDEVVESVEPVVVAPKKKRGRPVITK